MKKRETKRQRQIMIKPSVESLAGKVADKIGATSFSDLVERLITMDPSVKAFYQECADLEGVSLEEWLKSADKGEF